MNFRELVRLALAGGPGFLQLAVTNACNARCPGADDDKVYGLSGFEPGAGVTHRKFSCA